MKRTSVCALILACTVSPLAAQVGHAPEASPYRDIRNSKSVTLLYGDVGGDGGVIGVGPHHGKTYGARFDIRAGGAFQLGLSLARGDMKRLIVSAADSVKNRTDGPVSQTLTMFEAVLQLNLTGRKSWHHLAPFVSGSVGYVGGSKLPPNQPDSSGYHFGGKFYFAPAAGLRIFLGNTLHLRLEARELFWKLTYPSAYNQEPAAQISIDPSKPNSVLKGGKLQEWTGGRELRAGLGFSF
jgi:hypothetical protein